MFEYYIRWNHILEAMRESPAWPELEGLAKRLRVDGYGRRYGHLLLSGAAHFAIWMHGRGVEVAALNAVALEDFAAHLSTCRCEVGRRYGRYLQMTGARKFLQYLAGDWITRRRRNEAPASPMLDRFREWARVQRNLQASSVRQYLFALRRFVAAHGDDPARYTPKAVRTFVIQRAENGKLSRAKMAATALRTFLRFAVANGLCGAGILAAIPRVPKRRLVELPRSLPAEAVSKIIASVDGATASGARDRAILLLLARLGLRASDVVRLRVADIDWEHGRIMVSGKSRRETSLPLPQEVGDAILAYLEHRRPSGASKALFLSNRRPFSDALGVSGLGMMVRSAIWRAEIKTVSRGPHVLRHSFATEMLRQGAPLDLISGMLRHRDLRTTGIYAKVDVTALLEVAQPWPAAVLPC